MKLFGNNNRKKRQAANRNEDGQPVKKRTKEEQLEIDRMISAYQKKKKRRKMTLIVTLVAITAIAVGLYSVYVTNVRPPEQNDDKRTSTTADTGDDVEGDPPAEASETGRNKDKYTFFASGYG